MEPCEIYTDGINYSILTLEQIIEKYSVDKKINLADGLTDMEIQVTDWLHARTKVVPTETPLTYIVQDF